MKFSQINKKVILSQIFMNLLNNSDITLVYVFGIN